jgi:hypothetical protein
MAILGCIRRHIFMHDPFTKFNLGKVLGVSHSI